MEEKITENGRRVSLWLSNETIEKIDRLAKKADIERGRLLRNLIDVNIRSLERSEKIGIFHLALVMRSMQENLNAWVDSMSEDPEGFVSAALSGE